MRREKAKSRLCSVILVFTSLGGAAAWGQCSDSTTYFYALSQATRKDGNTVKLYNETTDWGDYYNLWDLYISSAFYLNGTLEGSSPWAYATPIGTTATYTYTPTLQYWGPGQYYTSASHGAYAPACNQWVTWPPFYTQTTAYTNDAIQISRPARPDYLSGYPTALWFLGAGIQYDGTYPAVTVFTPGNANGAPESPVYVISAGSSKLSLSCNNCVNPIATATAASAYCLAYDIVVNASYNGFLSDPFYLFINRPWNLVATTDPVGGTWVYTVAKFNGYETHVNYQTQGMCSSDPPMSGYDINEFFGYFTGDYPGENWSPGGPESLSVAAGHASWFDTIAAYNDGAAPGDPAMCNTGACVPPFTNPGGGPHTLVGHRSQSWFAGASAFGSGARVQSDVLQQYTESGWHDQIVTPNP
jgi:hypothetical protein